MKDQEGIPLKRNEATRTGSSSIQRKKEFSMSELYKREESCLLSTLKHMEELTFTNRTRLLFVSPDRRRRLDPVERDGVKLPSRTLAVYSEAENTTRTCTICVNGVWSQSDSVCRHVYAPQLEYCERDRIETGVFMLEDGTEASVSQNLFEPNSVKVIYRLSETTTICAVCLPGGIWSKIAQSSLCNDKEAFVKLNNVGQVVEAKMACKLSDLDKCTVQ